MGFPTITVAKNYHPYFYVGIREEDFSGNKLLESYLILNRWCEKEYLEGSFSKSANGERAERGLRSLIRDKLDKTYEDLDKQNSAEFNIFNNSTSVKLEKIKDATPRSRLTVVRVEFHDWNGAFHKKNTESYGKIIGREPAIKMVTIDCEFHTDQDLPYKYRLWVDLAPIAQAINCLPGIEKIKPEVLCGEIIRNWLWLDNGNKTLISNLTKKGIRIDGRFTDHHINGQLNKENVTKSYLGREGSKIQFEVGGSTLDYGEPPLAPIFRIELIPWQGYDWVSDDIEHAANLIKSHLELNRQ